MKTLRLDSLGVDRAYLERVSEPGQADFVAKDYKGNVLFAVIVKDNNVIEFARLGGLFEELDYYCGALGDSLNEDDRQRIETCVRELIREEVDGIESDITGADEDTLQPFNPKDISMVSRIVTTDTLMRRIEQGTIILNPDFQRREVWDMQRKSRLIESLFLRIPIPMFYVSSDSNDNWTVVDGLQRISTMRDFILGQKYLKSHDINEKGNGFKLENLEFWDEYNGHCFNDLPVTLQNRIVEAEFSFTIINPPTPEDVKLNIFKRINTGGMRLSFQEIRNALYIGPSTDLLKRLAGSDDFKRATDFSIHADRMQDQELVLRMLSFMIRDYKSYQRTLTSDDWLSQSMIILNYMGYNSSKEKHALMSVIKRNKISMSGFRNYKIDELESRFGIAMKRARKLFGKYAFRKSYEPLKRTPINKSLFEVWGNILATLSYEEFEALYSRKSQFEEDYHRVMRQEDFVIAISRDSMKWQSVSLRYDTLQDLCKYIIYDQKY